MTLRTTPFAKTLVAAMLAGLAAAACSVQALDEQPCPPQGTALSYENFGRGFFSAYCTECHGGPHGHSSRSFVTLEAIRADRERIYLNSAGSNTAMPPGPDDPSAEMRNKLGEWLACGAP